MEHCIHLISKHFVVTVFPSKNQRKRSKAPARVVRVTLDVSDNEDDNEDDADAPWATVTVSADADEATEAILWEISDLLGKVLGFTAQVLYLCMLLFKRPLTFHF